ncbi:MAG: PLAT/LH2 domain-containing protein, partial [Nitrosopumilus sp.]|nr:PLAT/LH2 domain-containing protein [Nitrosopumilus sp.]
DPSGSNFITDASASNHFLDNPVWRARIIIEVSDEKDANTDGWVFVQLNSDNITWLDYYRDDFERGTTNVYDLRLDNVDTIKDINLVKIGLEGKMVDDEFTSDGICIKSILIVINDGKIYFQNYDHLSPYQCRWIDPDENDDPIYVNSNSIFNQNNELWESFETTPYPSKITKNELISKNEMIIGHWNYDSNVHWDRNEDKESGYSFQRLGSNVFQMFTSDLKLERSLARDSDLSITTHYAPECIDGFIIMNLVHYDEDEDFSWTNFLVPNLKFDTRGLWSGLDYFTWPTNNKCPTFNIDDNGDINLDYSGPQSMKALIPEWVRSTMQWYVEGQINEKEMIAGLQFLINERIIIVD